MRIIKYFIFLCCFGCNQSEKLAVSHIIKDSITTTNGDSRTGSSLKARSIKDLQKYVWSPNHPDTAAYLCEIHFEDEYAMNFFHGQCIWFFFTNTTYAKDYQQVELEWTYKTDCLLNMSFLEKSNGAKRYPKHGDIFAVYRLINDTTLSVEYKFPEWVKKVNQIAKDSLFPQRLYLRNLNGS